jgi:hypothetical protein
MQKDFWACLQVLHGNTAGLLTIQREGESLYIYRVDVKSASDREIQCFYYNILEDINMLGKKHTILNIYVTPLYGYGTSMYTNSINHLCLGKEFSKENSRVLLTYKVCSSDVSLNKRTVEFFKYNI